MSTDPRTAPTDPKISWPQEYETPRLSPLGSVWDHVGGAVGGGGDSLAQTPTA